VTFREWVNGQVGSRFGTMTALASAVGMGLSPFIRGVQAGTLNVHNLLKLAQATETHPSEVLRLAGKADVAALLEQLYGAGRDSLTSTQRDVLDLWGQVDDPEGRAALLYTLRQLAKAGSFSRPAAARESARAARGSTRPARR
jgi:hypothetical protein